MSDLVSLSQFLAEERRRRGLDPELVALIEHIAGACRRISYAVNRGALAGILGSAGSANVQGEQQQTLDVVANEAVIDSLKWTGLVAGMASEEMDEPITTPSDYPRGKYLVNFDPLDGSSNIEVNISVGSIFSILNAPNPGVEPRHEDYLQPGTSQAAAVYCVYGSATTLTVTTGKGVANFTLDPGKGDFFLTEPSVTIPEDTKEFAINMSNRRFWEGPVRRYVDECLEGKDGPRGKDFNMRWVASMVAEVTRILNRGGIFMYPFDHKDPSKPGRLRLMYEANPMSFIVEQAGGASTTGRQRIMSIRPSELHQRVPVVLGSRNEVQRVTDYHHEAEHRSTGTS